MSDERPTWDEIWMAVAVEVSRRSRCVRRYAAVIVDASNRVAAVGHNGPPADLIGTEHGGCTGWCPHASETPGATPGYATCVAIHAEVNAIMRVAHRDALRGGTVYVNGYVCWDCAKIIANSGLTRVVMIDDGATYRNVQEAIGVMQRSGLDVEVVY